MNSKIKRYGLAVALTGLMGFGAQNAMAALSYCSDTGGNTDGLLLGDVTFADDGDSTNPLANDCYGIVSGNDDAAAVNDINKWDFTDPVTNAPILWEKLVKSDGEYTNTFNNWLKFTIGDLQTGKIGDWELRWEDVTDPVSALPNLPVFLDFVAVLKGATSYAAYLFEGIELKANETASTGKGTGTFTMKILNNGGNIADISHLSLYVRQTEGSTGQTQIPEPNVLALLGIGLLGFAGTSLRRRKARKG